MVEGAMVRHEVLSSEVFGDATVFAIWTWLGEALAGDIDVRHLPLTFGFGR
jgi:hypothetical protein